MASCHRCDRIGVTPQNVKVGEVTIEVSLCGVCRAKGSNESRAAEARKRGVDS